MADTVSVEGLEVCRAAFLSRDRKGREATGSAASLGGTPSSRAYFELVERVSTMEALELAEGTWPAMDWEGGDQGAVSVRELFPRSEEPGVWEYSRSNGIALHEDFHEARRRAVWELVERDRVLRSWYGAVAPERVELPRDTELHPFESLYDWHACMLPEPDPRAWTAPIRVGVVVGFPRARDVPLAHGFAARDRARAALEAASGEALQRLAFLWDEAIPHEPPAPVPSPQLHLDWYLYPGHHDRLAGWLDGHHARFGVEWPGAASPHAPPTLVDITPRWLRGNARVIKATSPQAVPLTFGLGPPALSGHLPSELRIHPVA